MKSILKISYLVIYVFFMQISPFVHWHVHDHQGELNIQVSVHAPEFPVEHHAHDDHHVGMDEHQHRDIHLDADRDYTIQVKTINRTPTNLTFTIINIPNDNKEYYLTPPDIPLKVPRHYLATVLPDRAPPHLTL